ncbi:MAG: DEAD/DEAH box helicase, partial [bacterium]|nr:DEAD/DEAH box helicase [bacterium]
LGTGPIDGGEDYVLQKTADGYTLFFQSNEGTFYFAVPQTQSLFERFFDFLAAGREFFTFDFPTVLEVLKKIASPHLDINQSLLDKFSLQLKPQPVLKLYPTDGMKASRLEIDFDYPAELKKFLHKHPDKQVFTYDKDTAFENMCYKLLKRDKYVKQMIEFDEKRKSIGYFYYFKKGNHLDWVTSQGYNYLEKGFRIYMAEWNRFFGSAGSRIQVGITQNIEWLEFTPTIHYTAGEKEQLEESCAIVSIDTDTLTAVDKAGKLHLLSKNDIQKLADLYRFGERYGDTLRIPSENYLLIEKLYDKRMAEMPELERVLQSAEKLKSFDKIADYPVSPNFKAELRDYQKEGFKWLCFLQEYNFPGCLADDMGLGKTVQTLALLQTLKDQKKLKTSLLVAPVSAIPNWENEINRFTTGMSFHRHIGIKRDRDTAGWKKTDIVITSYATMRNDIEMLSSFDFDYIILDESQNIKNFTSRVSKAARVLKSKHRLALSGTPIENNSTELWALFDFLLPRYLGSRQWFTNNFVTPVEREKDEEQADLLKQMIYPFILRRKKDEVESQLPEKIEIVSKLRMRDEQAALYDETARYFRGELEKEMDEKGVGGSSIRVLEGMLRLRQLCLFPGLVNSEYKTVPSAKFEHFKGLLEDIIAEGHKVLVFSQFVEALKMIRGHLDDSAVDYSYIDGSVDISARGETIRRFQEDENRRVFLLSLKAGGVALNLTAADYVIIFDPWWNPAVEAQAIDRSHRIGQTKKVLVYRMVIEGSIEEKMLQLQENKKELVDKLVVSDSGAFKNLKRDDILQLFK